MKHITFLTLLVTGLLLGCKENFPEEQGMEIKRMDYNAVQKIFAEHLYLEGQNYVLKLPLEEALALGVSEDEYQNFIKDLDEGNRHTQECIEKGIVVTLADPQEDLARMRQGSIAETGNVTWEDRFYKSVILPDRINQSISITKIY